MIKNHLMLLSFSEGTVSLADALSAVKSFCAYVHFSPQLGRMRRYSIIYCYYLPLLLTQKELPSPNPTD